MAAWRFIGAMLAFCVLVALLVAGFNVAVDPYLVFDRPRVPGFNALKPAAATRERMMKSYQSSRVSPTTVILGSSRTDVGLDSASPDWRPSMLPVYNLSIVGSDPALGLAYLRCMLDRLPPGQGPHWVVIGLDFESFLHRPRARAAPARPARGADELAERLTALSRPAGTPRLPPLRVLQDEVMASLTLDATLDSLDTLGVNRKGQGLDMKATGELSDAQMRAWTRDDGANVMFMQKHQLTVQQYLHPRQVLGDGGNGAIRDMIDIDTLIGLARQHALHLVLMIQPAHASHLELLDGMGYWPDYERWKRALTERASAARASGLDVQLWDFGGYDAPATEPVPAVGDRSRAMNWFWDPLHYNARLGAQMIAAISGRPSVFPADALLTPDQVEARLAQVRRDRADYRRQQAAQIEPLRRLLCAAGSCPAAGT